MKIVTRIHSIKEDLCEQINLTSILLEIHSGIVNFYTGHEAQVCDVYGRRKQLLFTARDLELTLLDSIVIFGASLSILSITK